MRDHITIGSTPYDESCAQVGSDRYHRVYRAECLAFINQLRRLFGPEPEDAYLRITSNPHDFGSYHEVICDYDCDTPNAVEYAYKCEAETPAEWDDLARAELKAAKVCTAMGCKHDHPMCVEWHAGEECIRQKAF